MAERKHRFALLSYFEKVEGKIKKTKTPINRYSGQWAADAIIETYGFKKSKELVDRYFQVSAYPSWKGFANNAERVYSEWETEKEDKRQRLLMKERMRDWE